VPRGLRQTADSLLQHVQRHQQRKFGRQYLDLPSHSLSNPISLCASFCVLSFALVKSRRSGSEDPRCAPVQPESMRADVRKVISLRWASGWHGGLTSFSPGPLIFQNVSPVARSSDVIKLDCRPTSPPSLNADRTIRYSTLCSYAMQGSPTTANNCRWGHRVNLGTATNIGHRECQSWEHKANRFRFVCRCASSHPSS
jgi:hypothetical protein